jgi:hypothetical protein
MYWCDAAGAARWLRGEAAGEALAHPHLHYAQLRVLTGAECSCGFFCLYVQRNALSVLEMGPPETLDDPSQGSSSDTEAREPKLGTRPDKCNDAAVWSIYTHYSYRYLQCWL